MRYLTIFFILLIQPSCMHQNQSVQNVDDASINEIPLYAGSKSPRVLNKNDENYDKLYKGSMRAAELGWTSLYKEKDLKTAIRRFNQAWLLNSENAQAYWGLGIVTGMQAEKEDSFDKFKQSVELLEKANSLELQNVNIMVSLGNAYKDIGCFAKEKNIKVSEDFLKKADLLYEKAENISTDNGAIYYGWAVCLFYQGRYVESKNKVAKANELKFKVPSEFIKDLDSKIKTP